MQVDSFLLDLLFDMYEAYCFANGVNKKEYDSWFIKDGGIVVDEVDFLINHSNDVLCDEVINAVYEQICEAGLPNELDKDSFVAMIANKYYLYNYDNNNSVIKYLNSASVNEIFELFKTDQEFGIDLIKAYFQSIVHNTWCEEQRKRIYENHDEEYLLRYEKITTASSIIFLNDLLRTIICNLYNHFIANGHDDIPALNCTWAFFTQNFDPLGELDKLGLDVESKNYYKQYMLGLIYADVYEDACNTSIIDSDADRFCDVTALLAIAFGNISIPREEGVRNRILKHFILLQDEREKRKENRRKTYEDGRIDVLKKVNPVYKLDELTF